MKKHHLKLDEKWETSVMDGTKKAEVRFNDRDYQTGDMVEFEEANGLYRITHVLHSVPGLEPGYVVLSLAPQCETVTPEQ